MRKERSALMEKARAKKKRRDQTKLAKTAPAKSASRRPAPPITGVVQKVVDIVQEAASEVGAVAKAAAVKFKGAALM